MINQIYISCDGDWLEPEIQISGSADGLSYFGKILNEVKGCERLELSVKKNEYYPVNIKKIIIEQCQFGNDLISVKVNENNLNLGGTTKALNKLGDSLINFFDEDTSIGEHFHLDYYEGNNVLNETTCHLIFLCNSVVDQNI